MSTTWREGVGAFSPRSTSLPSTTAKLSYHMSFYYTGHPICAVTFVGVTVGVLLMCLPSYTNRCLISCIPFSFLCTLSTLSHA
jgi:hypothetical protein